MRVLDLFSGLGGWGAAFRDRGHTVVTADLDPRFGSDLVLDVNDLRGLNGWDVILASPPCECFSVMTIGKNWNKDRTPKTERAAAALALARHTFDLIYEALRQGAAGAVRPQDRKSSLSARGQSDSRPLYYVVENPRGMLRKLAPTPPNATTWYCRWGMPYAKPTDLWTNLNGGSAIGWPTCVNRHPDHERAPRGSKTGVQRDTWEFSRSALYAETRSLSFEQMRERIKGITGRDYPVGGRGTNHDGPRAALRALIPYRLSLAVCLASERDGTLPSMEEVLATEAALRAREGEAA